MPQRRGLKQPKQDHSVYVQQLFKDFLTRNHGNSICDTRNNFFRSVSGAQRKQPSIFDRAVYARFERDTNNGGFTRHEPTGGMKTGLMKWIDQQRSWQPQRDAVQKTARSDDYLNLPGNFFSGSEQIKLPFDIADRTIGNVTNNFIPPATSTPFDRTVSFGTSGVLFDPDEFQTCNNIDQPCCWKASEWNTFLNEAAEYFLALDQRDSERCSIQQRLELKFLAKTADTVLKNNESVDLHKRSGRMETHEPTLPRKHNVYCERPSSRDHSLQSNQIYDEHQKYDAGILATPITQHFPDTFPVIPEMIVKEPQTIKIHEKRNVTFVIDTFSQSPPLVATTQDDILLTASPPSPTSSMSRKHCLKDENTFLFHQMPTDDTLMEKLDALLSEEDLIGSQDGLDNDFDFSTPLNQITTNVTFPTCIQSRNQIRENSIVNSNMFPTSMHFSPNSMSETHPVFPDSMF